MASFALRALFCLLFPWSGVEADSPVLLHHELAVSLDPQRGRLEARDRVVLPAGFDLPGSSFVLHEGLRVEAGDAQVQLLDLGAAEGPVPLRRYRVISPPRLRELHLVYSGVIAHALHPVPQGQGTAPESTPGLIAAQGVYLDGGSGWYPSFGATESLTFDLELALPEGWGSMSQGEAQEAGSKGRIRWVESHPQDEIFLIAARFEVYQRDTPFGRAMVLLRGQDPQLAERYLEATSEYLGLYSRLIGPYPYHKFALVENFWETGYGMPSFTLLGPRVLRLPFIVRTSYPHEILHNWWGNGVYVDYANGNWSEGLTSYLADYLLEEQEGRGVQYRRGALQKYADYVHRERDFPLSAFRARHGEVTQAIGYSKGLMFFHMLRRELGDAPFLEGLRQFYSRFRFRRAGFAELRSTFEAVSGRDLSSFFEQWVERTGAPSLRVVDVAVDRNGGNTKVRGILEQTQEGPVYSLRVPVVVQRAGEEDPSQFRVAMDGKRVGFALEVAGDPVRLAVDPQFDLFRRLDRSELPASVGQLLGAPRIAVVLPSGAPPELHEAYRALARSLLEGSQDSSLLSDADLDTLPADRSVWVLGWENRFFDRVGEALGTEVTGFGRDGLQVDGHALSRAQEGVVLTAQHPAATTQAIGWLGAPDSSALAALARKLPHYGRYSYLAFRGPQAENVLKGQWTVRASPLRVELVPGAAPFPSLPSPPLTDLLEPDRSERSQRPSRAVRRE